MCYLVDDGVEGVGDLRLGARAALPRPRAGRQPVAQRSKPCFEGKVNVKRVP